MPAVSLLVCVTARTAPVLVALTSSGFSVVVYPLSVSYAGKAVFGSIRHLFIRASVIIATNTDGVAFSLVHQTVGSCKASLAFTGVHRFVGKRINRAFSTVVIGRPITFNASLVTLSQVSFTVL